jgi:2-C-methyl-D-erythritol 4-phosphate cytidylyltransferase
MNVYVIIPAAGLGTRMAPSGGHASKTAKQFAEIAGTPILVRTLRQFAVVKAVTEIVVALRASEIKQFQPRLDQEKFAKPVRLVAGGDNRQDSVHNALRSLTANADDLVLVHDGVRPFVDPEIIENVIKAAKKHAAAIAGVPAIDTVKQVDRTADGALIKTTIPREKIVLAQTPQGFRFDLIQRAFEEAAVVGFVGTDEASLVERIGHPVHVVMGSPRNLKITTPADMELAKYLAAEGKSG